MPGSPEPGTLGTNCLLGGAPWPWLGSNRSDCRMSLCTIGDVLFEGPAVPNAGEPCAASLSVSEINRKSFAVSNVFTGSPADLLRTQAKCVVFGSVPGTGSPAPKRNAGST